MFFSHRMTVEESDSDSDEDVEGGVRHDLMMADEKVECGLMYTWKHTTSEVQNAILQIRRGHTCTCV